MNDGDADDDASLVDQDRSPGAPFVRAADSAFPFERSVDESIAGARLDAALAQWLPDFSRTLLKKAIDGGHVVVSGASSEGFAAEKPSLRLEFGMVVRVERLERPAEGPRPQAIALDLLYEDDDLVAVNKPSGMVVHPAKGHWEGTLASALAHHFGANLSTTGGPTRPGIVHRLDRDTSGVLVVAKNDRAHERLAAQFHDRTVEKQYVAIVLGPMDRDADVVDKPIGSHPTQRDKMAVREGHPDSREAVTKFVVAERFRRFTLVRAFPKTGRTHQIRVHLAHAGWPILCDRLYGGRSRITLTELEGGLLVPGEPALLMRQALHAERLEVDQPTTGARLSFEAPLAPDIARVLRHLRSPR
ncbi:MAG: RluA family pseudouridine synthase [Lacipirellulaceae bacterium]